jgi:hypothetical protein
MTTEKKDLDLENARLAYTIIQSLLDGHEALSDLLVLMSHALDEDTLKALTGTNEWQKYLESKRSLENTKGLIEKLSGAMKTMEADGIE